VSVVALLGSAGTAASTTTSLLFAATAPVGQSTLFAECDSSGGDVAAWCELRESPGWASAVAAGDRTWAGLRAHLQQLPSGLAVLCAPTRGRQARVVVREAAARFGLLLDSAPDVVTFADCGRVDDEVPVWTVRARLVVLLVRQAATSTGATVARVDRAAETFELLRGLDADLGLVVIGARPYPPDQVAAAAGAELLGVLPEDPVGAGLAAGGWTLGRGAGRSALARAARAVSARLVERVAASSPVVGTDRRVEREVVG
jgi:hypothetical protein